MTTEERERLKYLWDGPEAADWVLLDLGEPEPAIFNRRRKNMLVIEDDDLHHAVVEEMRSRGAETLTKL